MEKHEDVVSNISKLNLDKIEQTILEHTINPGQADHLENLWKY
jgi:hypothetical protein